MDQKPANPRLWNMLVVQARAKYRKWPSLPASKWVHTQYVNHGGRFINAEDEKRVAAAREQVARKKKIVKDKKDDKS